MFRVFIFALALAGQSGTVTGSAEAVDGSSVRIDGVEYSLWGLDAPGPGAICADDGGEPYHCDEAARAHLAGIIAGAASSLELAARQGHPRYEDLNAVRCEVQEATRSAPSSAIARCELLIPACMGPDCTDRWFDLTGELIEVGLGAQRRDETDGRYDELEVGSCYGRLGVWGVADGAGVARAQPHLEGCDSEVMSAPTIES